MYVDGVITGVEDEEKAYEFYKDSKSLMKTGGFKIYNQLKQSANTDQ